MSYPKLDTGITPLHTAASEGNLSAAETLIESGASVNAATASGATPLHKAAFYGHSGLVDKLLSAGADPTLRDEGQCTARDLAYRGVPHNVEEDDLNRLREVLKRAEQSAAMRQ